MARSPGAAARPAAPRPKPSQRPSPLPTLPDPAARSNAIQALRNVHAERKAALIQRFLKGPATALAASRLLTELSRATDQTLRALWGLFQLHPDAALIAVGGYGRNELFPHSDIDVLVLLPAAEATEDVADFITACWDAGLEIGSSVRTLDECVAEAQRDATVQTAMLEARWVAGSRLAGRAFSGATRAAVDPVAFLRAKTLEMQQRHVRHEGGPYALEPNCKESPGGLRDLQVLRWIANGAGLGSSWRELGANGLLTDFEAQQLRRHEGTLKLIRARLHAIAGRREDRLVFDLQTAVAESFGFETTPTQRASELLMHRYYWAAKAVTQLNQILLLNMEARITGVEDAPMRALNSRFYERGGLLEVADDQLYQRDPHAILETFLVYTQERGLRGFSARTLRALYNARRLMDARFRRDPVNRARFLAILQQPQGITHAMRLMNQTSVLGRYLIVFRGIVGRMQHDLFHVYTVDQHILMVLRNVRRFFIPEHAHEYPFCSQLASGFDKPWVLVVAALFHDIAKGRGGDHSILGEQDVRQFCADHGIGAEDTELCAFLVREHLTLSHCAQKEDLSDAAVIERFAARMGDERHLTALYLLTVADIRGTSPKVWNAWKGKLLEDLYRAALRRLGGASPSVETEVEHRQQEARQLLALHSALPGTEVPLWATLDAGYFARHEAAELAWHARTLWRHVRAEQPIVSARPSVVGDGLQVLVYAPDQPDLFARICGYFDRAGFNIQDAKIHTTAAGYALDTFQIVHAQVVGGSPAEHRDWISLVETQLAQVLVKQGPLPVPRSTQRVSRRVRSFPVTPHVSLNPDERAQRWLLAVSAADRAGLLYAIARVLAAHHVNLHLAKVSTLGERVEDTFVIESPALKHPRERLQLESELLDAVATA